MDPESLFALDTASLGPLHSGKLTFTVVIDLPKVIKILAAKKMADLLNSPTF